MVITVEDYKEIRQMRLAGLSQRQIAKRLGISRNTVKKYWDGDAVPWARKEYSRAPSMITPEVKAFIHHCIEQDQLEGIQKQKHTAKRIYDRLVEEMRFAGGESTIRRYVHELRGKVKEAFVPLAFQPGDAVQIDWGEATVWVNEEKQKVNLFCARLCYSDAPFVVAYRRQNSESFLEALVTVFDYFGGVSRRVIFDNAKVAVKDGFGAHAKAQESYAALAAHYGFEAVFCNPASGNEKGLVEGLVGFSRRNFCVPVPRVGSMEELNEMLRNRCHKYLTHTVAGKRADVGTLFREEQVALYSIPQYRFDPAKRAEAKVNAFSTVRYDTNDYSVPVAFCGKTVSVRATPERIEVYYSGKMIASHSRCFGHRQSTYRMEHYLPLLEKKGRSIFQAKPVRDTVPACFLDWLACQNLTPKELVALLYRSLEIGYDAVMRGEIPTTPTPDPVIQDRVPVSAVDLSAYDSLCGYGEEAAL